MGGWWRFSSRTPREHCAFAVLLAAGIGLGDSLTAAEGLFTLLYLLPLGLAAYFGGRSCGVILAGLATLFSFLGETAPDLVDHVGELGVFLAIALVVSHLRDALARAEGATLENRERSAHLSAARADAHRLLAALEQADESIVITNVQGTIEYVNPAFTRITGYAAGEALGQNPRILRSGRQDPSLYADLWRTIRADGVWRGELINRRKDGSEYVERMSVTPVRSTGAEITHFIAIKEDLTARRLLEEQLRQAQKMEAVGRLAGGVAHDFNNLLAIILGSADGLLREQRDVADRRKLEHIVGAAERAAVLTRQLLAFSRKQALQPRVLDLNAVVQDVSKMLRRLIGEDIQLSFVPDAALGPVKVDPGQLEQVILNLAVNARDAMPDGGRLRIETGSVEVDEAFACGHPGRKPGRYAVLTVSDTGCGMGPEVRRHLFEPFFTTKEPGKGTGLGLATVYGIVEQSGGCLEVESELGCGSRFRVYLPSVDEPLAARESSFTPPVRGTETILLVEDEESLRDVAREMLETSGYHVLVAGDGVEALKTAAQHRGPIDLLLTDVVMPGMNGRELAGAVVGRHPRIAVLYMSGHTDGIIAQHGLSAADRRLLIKPFTVGSLTRGVREALDGRRPEPVAGLAAGRAS